MDQELHSRMEGDVTAANQHSNSDAEREVPEIPEIIEKPQSPTI